MRLDEMPASVIDHVPGDARPLDVFGQKLLREILIEARPEVAVGGRLDVRPRRIHDLPGVSRQRAVGAGLEIGLLHDLPRRLADRDRRGSPP